MQLIRLVLQLIASALIGLGIGILCEVALNQDRGLTCGLGRNGFKACNGIKSRQWLIYLLKVLLFNPKIITRLFCNHHEQQINKYQTCLTRAEGLVVSPGEVTGERPEPKCKLT